MKYRKEIDGLRAVAVLPVILFHAGFEVFSGGFVGVDVFFVISGYLITTIILSEMEQGTFSLLRFYERRARRILPALFLVMFVCLPFAWLWLSPSDMEDFSQSLGAVSIFASNFLFWHEAGYWDAANELKPLLHTWSLAVEEQYYILFPPFLIVMWRYRKRWILGSFMAMAAVSLVASEWGATNIPVANFYLLPTRAWELAIGASIAFFFLYRKRQLGVFLSSKISAEMLGLVGVVMIGYSVFTLNETVPFPGFHALVPTIGTGLVIMFSSAQTVVGRLLGMSLLVKTGLVSYSAYLWHYPIFAFARHRSLTEPSDFLFAVLAVFSFLLAYLSWRFVERPFRKKGVFDSKTIFAFAFVGSVFFIVIALPGHLNFGWPGRMDVALTKALPELNEGIRCEEEQFQSENICELVNSPDKLTYLVGDSHARAISYEMQVSLSEKKVGLLHTSSNGCPPILGIYRTDGGNSKNLSCHRFNEGVYHYIQENSRIEYVVLLARWTLPIEGTRFNNTEGGVETSKKKPHFDLVVNGKPEYHPDYSHRAKLSERYAASVRALLELGKKVILVYPVPEVGWEAPNYVAKFYMKDPDLAFTSHVGSTSYEVFKERNKRSYSALDGVGLHPNLFRVYPERLLCNTDIKDRCIIQKDGHVLYRDDNHLSNAGAKMIVEQITRYIK